MRVRVRNACAYCARRENLRRTVCIALVVGVVLTVINQGGVIAGGDATPLTWVRCVLNFVVPFLVSNAGLLSAGANAGLRRCAASQGGTRRLWILSSPEDSRRA